MTVIVEPADAPLRRADPAGAVVLDYCAAVRGILNDDQGGPLHPPGLRMAEALDEVRESIQRNLDEKKGGSQRSNSAAWPVASTGVWTMSEPSKRRSETTSRTSRRSPRPSIPEAGAAQDRQEKFEELIDRFERDEDPIRQHMAGVMISFLAGLFVGEGKFEEIKDNLDLERWFRLPKSHERRIHGHRHAGVRIVQEGPTLVHALDAHVAHPGPFTAEDLLPYRTAREPPCQREAMDRRKIMRKARSKKKRPILLADLKDAIANRRTSSPLSGRCFFYAASAHACTRDYLAQGLVS